MHLLKQRKELISLIAVVILLGIAAHDLFSEQQDNTTILNSGKMIDPTTISGRAACEVPIPDISKRKQSELSAFEAKDFFN
ncbi:hypothetical protein [Fodinibius halophilus]|uniref:Uncharacterized protein n=1 Tax=Fodinibius halophilus TaxID=1736908 RepID=A0A6M1T9E8_9BACT|nr:hypothetical protein [Fodinibius halophilus]NGP87664.1 hypothetical protein [Fodinibius halophilus]